MTPQVAAAFKVLRAAADASGYGWAITDVQLQTLAADIVASVLKVTPA